MKIAAGLFLFVFGGLGMWLLRAHFSHARVLPVSYALLSLGGLAFTLWALVHVLAIGIAAAALLVLAGALGIVGAMRKEIRMFPPG